MLAYTGPVIISMNRLSTERRGQVISLLVEGMSIRATVRVTGVAKNTIVKLLAELEQACFEYQDLELRNLECPVIECDEIWSYCYSKQRTFPKSTRASSVTAMRGPGRPSAPPPSWSCRGWSVSAPIGTPSPSCRTSNPDPDHISTSYVERQNLTMRMGMRRFTRLTKGLSKKVENLAHAVSLRYLHCNFARPHSTLTKKFGKPTTPAMAAGVANYVWSVWEIAGLLD
jgi:hypothetical protein